MFELIIPDDLSSFSEEDLLACVEEAKTEFGLLNDTDDFSDDTLDRMTDLTNGIENIYTEILGRAEARRLAFSNKMLALIKTPNITTLTAEVEEFNLDHIKAAINKLEAAVSSLESGDESSALSSLESAADSIDNAIDDYDDDEDYEESDDSDYEMSSDSEEFASCSAARKRVRKARRALRKAIIAARNCDGGVRVVVVPAPAPTPPPPPAPPAP